MEKTGEQLKDILIKELKNNITLKPRYYTVIGKLLKDSVLDSVKEMGLNPKNLSEDMPIDEIGILISFYERAYKETGDSYYLIRIASALIHIRYYESASLMLKKYLSIGVLYTSLAHQKLETCNIGKAKMDMDYYKKKLDNLTESKRNLYIKRKQYELNKEIKRLSFEYHEERIIREKVMSSIGMEYRIKGNYTPNQKIINKIN